MNKFAIYSITWNFLLRKINDNFVNKFLELFKTNFYHKFKFFPLAVTLRQTLPKHTKCSSGGKGVEQHKQQEKVFFSSKKASLFIRND